MKLVATVYTRRMWKKIFGSFPGGSAPPPEENDDDDDDDFNDTDEEDGLEPLPAGDDWDALEENDSSWICRACLKPIDSLTDQWQDCGRAKVHRACLMCSICQAMLPAHVARFLKGSVWPYCDDCFGLAQMEAKLRKGAEMWGCGRCFAH